MLFRSTALQSLCLEMLCTPQTEAINRLLIPDLVQMKYPFPNLLSSLILPHSLEAVDQEWLLSVPPSIHLLYSILRLGEDQLGNGFKVAFAYDLIPVPWWC